MKVAGRRRGVDRAELDDAARESARCRVAQVDVRRSFDCVGAKVEKTSCERKPSRSSARGGDRPRAKGAVGVPALSIMSSGFVASPLGGTPARTLPSRHHRLDPGARAGAEERERRDAILGPRARRTRGASRGAPSGASRRRGKRGLRRTAWHAHSPTRQGRARARRRGEPGGTLFVSHTLPPMTEPAPMTVLGAEGGVAPGVDGHAVFDCRVALSPARRGWGR